MTELKKIIIDDQEIEVDAAMTLIQACELVGIEVPRFCYHAVSYTHLTLPPKA